MPENTSAQTIGVTSDERIRNTLRRQIQRAYDKHEFTREALARESGVNLHTIDAIVSRDPAKHRRIATEDAFNLAYTLGEDAVAALVGCIHYTATRHDPEAVAPAHLVASVLPHVSTLAQAAADGRIDHLERPACREAADHIIAIVTPLSSAGDAA